MDGATSGGGGGAVTRASVFAKGKHEVNLFTLDPSSPSTSPPPPPPPRPLLIGTPTENGDYPVLILLHGYLLYNTFYSDLIRHVSSHGFLVIAPQLYSVAGADATGDIAAAAATINWLPKSLSNSNILPPGVFPDLSNLAVAGHSRGGKAAFGVALGLVTSNLRVSAVIGIDPVDGTSADNQTTPPILTGVPDSLDLGGAPVLVIGCGLSELRKNPLFPACAPKGVNHRSFFDECRSPVGYVLARDYGHLDMLDDDTKGLRGKLSYCLCKSGGPREPMRRFVGGMVVAFLRAWLLREDEDLVEFRKDAGVSPVVLSEIRFR